MNFKNKAMILAMVFGFLLSGCGGGGTSPQEINPPPQSDAITGTGTNFVFPRGAVLDAANNRVLVVDSFLKALLSIDLATGNRMILSDAVTGTGTNLISPQGVAPDAANNSALVVDTFLPALFVVNLENGERVLISR